MDMVRIKFACLIFGIGALCEAYTFTIAKDYKESRGLGWGFLLAILIV